MRIILVASFFIISSLGFSQLDSLGNLTYDVRLNDIWGFEDNEGNEYALVGLYNGLSIVDVSNPNSPNEVFRAIGPETIWRDVKAYGGYAYVTNEADSGMRIYDLRGLPSNTDIPFKNFAGEVGQEFKTAHNVFIDENGKAYVVGSKRSQGMIIYDLTQDPWNPVEIGSYDDFYIHDVYVRNDTAFAAMPSEGEMYVLDVSNPLDVKFVSSGSTGASLTHNTWLSDDGDYVFTTDEVHGGEISVFDVSNKSDPEKVETFKLRTNGDEQPHNVLVKDSFLFISYYSEGVVVVDASNPENLVGLSSFDTDIEAVPPSSKGAWGVYPYSSSGNILVSDINNGLFVFGYQEQNAAYLEGVIKDSETGFPLSNVKVELIGTAKLEKTSFNGEYKLGIVGPGEVEVSVSLQGYYSDTINVTLIENEILIADVELVKIPTVNVTFSINYHELKGNGFAGVSLVSPNFSGDYKTNVDGELTIENVPIGFYDIYYAAWGSGALCIQDSITFTNNDFAAILNDDQYADDFSTDLGWETFAVEEDVVLERTKPLASYDNKGIQYDPSTDGSDLDCGDFAYCSGINPDVSAAISTINFTNYLVSPEIASVENIEDVAEVSFNYWLSFSGNSTDSMSVGAIVLNDTIYKSYLTLNNPQRSWESMSFKLVEVNETGLPFKLIFKVTDDLEPWNIIDVAIDNVAIQYVNAINDIDKTCFSFQEDQIYLRCGRAKYEVFNPLGQLVYQGDDEMIPLNQLQNGLFIIKVEGLKPFKVLK